MKTKTQPHEPLSEIRDFVATQAAEDAVLEPAERHYQAELVTDVLKQEPLKPGVFEELVKDYRNGVASHLKSSRIAA